MNRSNQTHGHQLLRITNQSVSSWLVPHQPWDQIIGRPDRSLGDDDFWNFQGSWNSINPTQTSSTILLREIPPKTIPYIYIDLLLKFGKPPLWVSNGPNLMISDFQIIIRGRLQRPPRPKRHVRNSRLSAYWKPWRVLFVNKIRIFIYNYIMV